MKGDVGVPPRALAIWRARPDLQRLFDVDSPDGRYGLVRWYFLEGYREMALRPDPHADERTVANQPLTEFPQHFGTTVTWLMRELWAREQARRNADRAARLPGWLARVARWISRRRNSLKSPGGQARMLDWYFTEGLAEARLLPLLSGEQAATPRGALASSPTERQVGPAPDAGQATPTRRTLHYPFGVNVIGHARGRSGISEDVRMAAASLERAGIEYAIHDLASAENLPAEDDSVSHLIRDDLPYAFNLFCTTVMDTVAAIAARPANFRQGRYTIGFWPWELAKWPSLWSHAYDFVDEVWASSRFTFDSHVGLSSKRIRLMPMAVSTADTEGLGRKDFGLPDDRFLFSFAFDGLSSFSRKNPEGCVAAFQRAFPQGTEPVALVLKGLRVQEHPTWQQLRLAAEADPRMKLLGDSISRGAVLDLHRVTDCFVSLHRAEGFGRNIAECMDLGKPVIVTAYSGNMDFTSADAAALVPYSLREIAIGEYPFAEGQQWADPDVERAAQLMIRMVRSHRWRARLASAGKAAIKSAYTADVVGAAYRSAFSEIWKSQED